MKTPSDWEYIHLSEIAEKVMVGIASAATHAYSDSGVRMLRNLNIKDGWIDDSDILHVDEEYEKQHKNKRLKTGDILTVRTGYPGVSAVVPSKYEGAQCFTSLITRLDQQRALPEYICTFINSEYGKKFITSGEAGGAQKNVNAGMLQKMPVPLPPLPEQKKIAQILSTWDKAITTTEQLLANSQQQKKALMQQLLTGKKRLLDENGVRFEGEWLLRPISTFIKESRIAGNAGDTAKKITVKLYGNGVVAKDEKRSGSESTKYYKRSAGQFIYSKLDFLNGAFGIIPDELDGYESTLDLPAFDFIGAVNIDWFINFVSREEFYTSNLGLANGGRKARRVNPADLLKIKMPTPSREEQQKIAAVLSTADQEIAALQNKLAALKEEKKALMQQLLTGKRRVKAEPLC